MRHRTADEGHFLLARPPEIAGKLATTGKMSGILLAQHTRAYAFSVRCPAIRHEFRPFVAALTASTP